MWSGLREEVARAVAARIIELFGVEHEPLVQTPPSRELGDLAFPAPLHLARVLRKSPRAIAEALVEGLELPPRVARVEVAGAGYLNVFLHRSRVAAELLGTAPAVAAGAGGKVVVEHTNINPNKAAHIGHLRNAVLGDVLVRVLQRLGHPVEVQNYIDDTGVQVADVVVGFLDLEGADSAAVEAIPEPFDYYCWDLYSRVGAWYEQDPERRALRQQTLHALESGRGERAEVGRLVARRVLRRHLATMRRLGIGYDLLTFEGDILGLEFFTDAFAQLRERQAVRLEEEGKNAGCWVMPLAHSEEFAGLEDPDKVIVRSDGTVTYVGKDIAYQLWKFGLLGRDFRYQRWEEEGVWETTSGRGAAEHPAFGGAKRVINVIDARQSYLQRIVRAGLEALGYREEADRSIHFAYEMVSLSAATARQLGYVETEEDEGAGRSLEMSGRKGIGVKADDLIDQLLDKCRAEIASRHSELAEAELALLASQIATAALRFFMVRSTTTRVIAFDLEEALSFEGETGPYLQYAQVRAANIRRKLAEAGLPDRVTTEEAGELPAEVWSDDLWNLVLTAAQVDETTARVGESLEISALARHALDLAQQFNAVYHRHPILQEEDRAQRSARLATTQLFATALGRLMELLGLEIPDRM